jgi:hypothetical protein
MASGRGRRTSICSRDMIAEFHTVNRGKGANDSMTWASNFRVLMLIPCFLLVADEPVEKARQEIVAAYQKSLDALRRGDADAAMQMDTGDWVSITIGQNPRTRQEMEPLIRRDIASLKPPPDWSASWKPDYKRNGTSSGIQIYALTVEGTSTIALCLVGNTRTEITQGGAHSVWRGSHVRDTWIHTSSGWKRRKHEKLTINEQMIDGHPVKQ